MSKGWPPFRYRFSTTLQSGTVFYQKKVEQLQGGAILAPLFFQCITPLFHNLLSYVVDDIIKGHCILYSLCQK